MKDAREVEFEPVYYAYNNDGPQFQPGCINIMITNPDNFDKFQVDKIYYLSLEEE